jgi:hypothetical protein
MSISIINLAIVLWCDHFEILRGIKIGILIDDQSINILIFSVMPIPGSSLRIILPSITLTPS